jgi:hypothetical protein
VVHVSIVMPWVDESENTFSIKGPYNLNYNESRNFSHIKQIRTWTGQKCYEWPTIPNYIKPHTIQGHMDNSDLGRSL